jgi:regulator of cell morphogenesis and NO signaling
MMTLNGRTRVSELQQGPPPLMQTLISTGLFRAGDDPDIMLGELCWTFGFNPGILLTMLQSANVEEEPAPLDIAPYRAMPLAELVEHVERVHHTWLRDNLPRLVAMTGAVAAGNPDDGRLSELHDEVQSLAAELDAHLRHEEESLFAMVRDLVTRGAVTPTRCGSYVGGPIACMETEHSMAVDSLRRMRELTDDYAVPDGAGAGWREMLAGLVDLDRDLREHMYKENEALFPRALDAQNRGAGTS